MVYNGNEGGTDPLKQDLGIKPTPNGLDGCKARCDASDNCIGLTWENDTSKDFDCTLFARCIAYDPSGNVHYITRSSYLKKDFSGGVTFPNIYPWHVCSETESPAAFHLSTGEPMNPQNCFTECRARNPTSTHMLIGRDGQCRCYSGCTKAMGVLGSGSPLASADAAHNTLYEFPPTQAPTTYPTGSPTGNPTRAPSSSPTGIPTRAPSGSPTGNQVTDVPTARPTGSPTDPSTTTPDAGVIIGSVGGLVALVALIAGTYALVKNVQVRRQGTQKNQIVRPYFV